MKFGKKIQVRFGWHLALFCSHILPFRQTTLYDEWKPSYLDYNGLKKLLKVRLQFISFFFAFVLT